MWHGSSQDTKKEAMATDFCCILRLNVSNASMARDARQPERMLTAGEVAHRLRVDVQTVRIMCREGRLRGFRLNANQGASPWLIPESAFQEFIEARMRRDPHE